MNVNDAGKRGKTRWTPLTEEGVAALRLFVEENAFGQFSQSSLYNDADNNEVPHLSPGE